MADWVTGLFGGLGVLFVGIITKRHNARIDKIESKVQSAMDEDKTRQLIEDKLDPLKAEYVGLHHRMSRIEDKIDTLIDLQLRDKN